MDFQDSVAKLFTKAGVKEAEHLIEVPPDPSLGDFALPCFSLGNPHEVAVDLSQKIVAPFIERVEAKGPYVNVFIKPSERAKIVLAALGQKAKKKNEKVMVEYSQPNTHKAFHIGHLRGTSIGESLARILEREGYDVVRANYSGDTGSHIAKWLWYYTTRDKSEPPKEGHELERWIASIYVRAIKELTEHPEYEDDVNEILRKLDTKEDTALNEIYDRTRQYSIDAFNTIYEDLHATFDVWYFEGDVEQEGKVISKRLVDEGIAKVDDGATIVDLEDEKLGVWVLLRKDGTALYSAKDLVLAERKFNEHHITTSVYVIGHAQTTHMRQLFATLKRMGFPHAEKCRHLSFSEVRLPDGKMSSRSGNNILYSDMRKEIAAYAAEEVRKRHEDWSDDQVNNVVDQVVVAALKWDMLAIHPNKAITFNPKTATQFEGETGPYVQYTHARACSILRKAGKGRGDGASLVQEKERVLLRLLDEYARVVAKAARDLQPVELAHYTMQLAKAFNSFYHDCQVIGTPEEADRLALVGASVRVLKDALTLLAIDAPEEM